MSMTSEHPEIHNRSLFRREKNEYILNIRKKRSKMLRETVGKSKKYAKCTYLLLLIKSTCNIYIHVYGRALVTKVKKCAKFV